MELADHVFRDRDLFEGIEHLIHHVGITGDLLFVAGLELGDIQAPQQVLDLAIGELGTLDASGGTDAFNGGDAAERCEFFRREAPDHAPLTLEFLQLGNEPEDFGSDGETRRQHEDLG